MANFLSEPRFDALPVVMETGSADDSSVLASDITLVRELRERGRAQRGLA